MDLAQLPFLGSHSWTRPMLLTPWPSGSPPACPGPKHTAASQWHCLSPSFLSLSVTKSKTSSPQKHTLNVWICTRAYVPSSFPLNVWINICAYVCTLSPVQLLVPSLESSRGTGHFLVIWSRQMGRRPPHTHTHTANSFYSIRITFGSREF